ARLDGASLGRIADEVTGVHDDAADVSRESQADDAPVVARLAPAPRLPAVHPFPAVRVLVLPEDRPRRLEKALLRPEELVVRRDDRAADALGGEVDEIGEGGGVENGRHLASRISPRGGPTKRPIS